MRNLSLSMVCAQLIFKCKKAYDFSIALETALYVLKKQTLDLKCYFCDSTCYVFIEETMEYRTSESDNESLIYIL